MGIVYALCDPDSLEIRYIGCTLRTLKERMKEHRSKVPHSDYPVYRWLRKLGREPEVCVLEETDEAFRAEERWIAECRIVGLRLLNLADGGECGMGGRTRTRPEPSAGDSFGRWTVLSTEKDKAFCRCECGNERAIPWGNLLSGRSRSCGCGRPGRPRKYPLPEPGETYGELIVISCDGKRAACRCSCGLEKSVKVNHLVTKRTRSCGKPTRHDGGRAAVAAAAITA